MDLYFFSVILVMSLKRIYLKNLYIIMINIYINLGSIENHLIYNYIYDNKF